MQKKTASFESKRLCRSFADIEHFNVNYDNFRYILYVILYHFPLFTEISCWIIMIHSSGASAISEGDIFIYSCSAQLISFEIESTSKEINCAEHEYMNMSPSLIALAPLLMIQVCG